MPPTPNSQVAFYARLIGDVAGRVVPPRLQAGTLRRLAGAVAVKAALLPLLLAAIPRPSLVGGDLGLMAIIVVNWVLSGLCNTGAYLVAPTLAPQHRERVGGMMALAFQSSCFLGLLAATAARGLLGDGSGAAAPAAAAAAAAAAAQAVPATEAAAAAAAAGGGPGAVAGTVGNYVRRLLGEGGGAPP
jgi:hypothetical protein